MKCLIALTLSLALGATAASAKDIAFTLENATSSAVTEFYLSAPSVDNWEENLVTSPVQPGASAAAKITGADSCVFDVHTVFEDGTSTEDREYNLCENPDYKIEEE
jgi:hypothetical protein